MKFRFSLFYFLFAFLGCSSSNGDIDKPENNGGAEEGNIEVSGDKVIVTPLSYDQAFRNPMMGWRDVFSVGLDPIPANYPLPYGSVLLFVSLFHGSWCYTVHKAGYLFRSAR